MVKVSSFFHLSFPLLRCFLVLLFRFFGSLRVSCLISHSLPVLISFFCFFLSFPTRTESRPTPASIFTSFDLRCFSCLKFKSHSSLSISFFLLFPVCHALTCNYTKLIHLQDDIHARVLHYLSNMRHVQVISQYRLPFLGQRRASGTDG